MDNHQNLHGRDFQPTISRGDGSRIGHIDDEFRKGSGMRFGRKRLVALTTWLLLVVAMVGFDRVTASATVARSSGVGPQLLSFQIRARHSDKCLDVIGSSQADGAVVQQWTCLGSFQTNQLWRIEDSGDGATYFVKALHSGKCLDVIGSSHDNGAAVHQWTCVGYNQSNQRWYIDWVGGNYYTMRPAHALNNCLDVIGSSGADGATVYQWACLGLAQFNQHWRFVSS